MYAAGLHFGHDASATVVDESGLLRFFDKERHSRVKHAMGLATADVRAALSDLPGDVAIGLSSTQHVPLFFDDALDVQVDGAFPLDAVGYFAQVPSHHPYRRYVTWMGELARYRGVVAREGLFPYGSWFNEGFNRSYDALGMVSGQFPALTDAMRRKGEIKLDGKAYPAWFYQHHYLHAYYAAWTMSSDRRALVISADGGVGPSFAGGGVYFWTPGQRLAAVTPIDGWLGLFYTEVGDLLGLARGGAAGKLMGLAPYGRPIYFDPKLLGTHHQVSDGYRLNMREIVVAWLARCGLSPERLPAWDQFSPSPPALIADIAASAQLVLEHNVNALVGAAIKIARRAGFEFETIALCGGLALNCPANSNLAVTLDQPILVPPAVNDEGLSIGAAVAAYFDATGEFPTPPTSWAQAAYIGTDLAETEILSAAARHEFSKVGPDGALAAVERLLDDELVALCVGRAEVGPRALGHRSILANAGSAAAWPKANALKRREAWRPFAPAVLFERSAEYFDRGPVESRFMLFNYRCKTKDLPAITHYDHSARIQQVSAETGLLYEILKELERRGLPPVVLNTSFNGPAVPIVDTAEEAFAEAVKLGIRYVATDFGLFAKAG